MNPEGRPLGQLVSVATTHLGHGSRKAATGDMSMSGRGFVFIKLGSQKLTTDWIGWAHQPHCANPYTGIKTEAQSS